MEENYTVQEAARILRTTERTVRRRLERGVLEGSRDEINNRWRVSVRSVHAALPERPPKEVEGSSATPSSPEVADLRQRVEDLMRQLGRLEGQRELEEVTQSTLREQLERERERADAERERADQVELEARRLRAALEEARKPERPWWRRLFGG